jgi:hypothetical protein
MKKFAVLTVLLFVAGCSHLPFSKAVPRSSLTCNQATGAIEIDGRLREFSWLAARPIELVNFDGQPAHQPTTAKMVWDEEALFIAFTCRDPDLYVPYDERDGALYNQDVVEVFINEQSLNRGHFVEFEISPTGTLFDTYNIKPFTGILDWTSGLEAGTALNGTINQPEDEDEGYVVEMRIPWGDLSLKRGKAPMHGEKIRMNLYRINYQTPAQIGKRGVDPSFMTWSPTIQANFHKTKRFGTVTFSRWPAGSLPPPPGQRKDYQAEKKEKEA